MGNIEQIQDNIVENIKQHMRTVLGTDELNCNIQAVTIITNKLTGKLDINGHNIVLDADIKKLLNEALDSIKRGQLVQAIFSIRSNK